VGVTVSNFERPITEDGALPLFEDAPTMAVAG
jgi:hypothetical protein